MSTVCSPCKWPAARYRSPIRAGEAAGQILIHSIDLEPGPLVRELSTVLGTASTVKLAQQSKVDFKMVQGRVYHRGLELQFPEIMVRTYGSVGFDQSLAIMAEMNVPPKWLRDNALGNAIKDKSIKIPIAGTLDRPQLDKNALNDCASENSPRRDRRSAARRAAKATRPLALAAGAEIVAAQASIPRHGCRPTWESTTWDLERKSKESGALSVRIYAGCRRANAIISGRPNAGLSHSSTDWRAASW